MEFTKNHKHLNFVCTHQIGPNKACFKPARWVEARCVRDDGFMSASDWDCAAWCDDHVPSDDCPT